MVTKTVNELFLDIEGLFDMESRNDITPSMVDYTVHYYGKHTYSSHIIKAIDELDYFMLDQFVSTCKILKFKSKKDFEHFRNKYDFWCKKLGKDNLLDTLYEYRRGVNVVIIQGNIWREYEKKSLISFYDYKKEWYSTKEMY